MRYMWFVRCYLIVHLNAHFLLLFFVLNSYFLPRLYYENLTVIS